MRWTAAVRVARTLDTLTEEEWCSLYVSRRNPTEKQIKTASATAKRLLVDAGAVRSDTPIDETGGWER